MKELKSTRYMQIFTTFGYFIGFGIILYSSIFSSNKLLIVVGVIVIFLARTIGYGIDRLIEYKEANKEG